MKAVENLETEETYREQDRRTEFQSLRLESAGMGNKRIKSFSVTGMGSWSTKANAGQGKTLFGGTRTVSRP